MVQFGGGIFDKAHSRVEEVSLRHFERGHAPVQVVDHSNLTWIGLWKLPPPLPPERIVARARCLAERSVDAAYNLVGRNCETVALWCVCGMGESLQRQRFQAVWAVIIGGPVSLYVSHLAGRKQLTRRHLLAIWAWIGLRATLLLMYYRHNRRFYRDAEGCKDL